MSSKKYTVSVNRAQFGTLLSLMDFPITLSRTLLTKCRFRQGLSIISLTEHNSGKMVLYMDGATYVSPTLENPKLTEITQFISTLS